MSGIFRRGTIWWARLVVPIRLRTVAGRSEFVQSTGTREYGVAKLVAASLLAKWRRQLYEWEHGRLNNEKLLRLAESGPALLQTAFHTLKSASQIIGLDSRALLQQVVAGRLGLFMLARAEHAGHVIPLEAMELVDPLLGTEGGLVVPLAHQMPQVARAASFGGQYLQIFHGAAIAGTIVAEDLFEVELTLLEAPQPAGWLFVPTEVIVWTVDDLLLPALALENLRLNLVNRIDTARLEHARSERDEAIPDKLRAELSGLLSSVGMVPSAPHTVGKWANKKFSEAVDAYCSSTDGLPNSVSSLSEIRQRRAGLMVFVEYMGDRCLSDIDADLLREFRDGPLKTIPASINKLPKELRRDSLKETIAALKADGREWPLLSDEMRSTRMNWFVALFGWLHTKQYINSNPASPLKGETGKTKAERIAEKQAQGDEDEEGREPFSPEQLSAIFGQAHYKTGHGRHVKKPSYWYGFEYWLPLLGLYAGLRIKEASQLHLSDVRQVDGIWCLDINRKTPDKALKNEQSIRLVPVHSKLVRLGFLDYCDALRAAGYRRVFPELTWSKSDAKYAKESGRKMSKMLFDLGMPRDGTLVYHCLRHNMNNAMLRVPVNVIPHADELLKKYIRHRIMGHEVGTDANTRHYTSTTSGEMAALIEGVSYDLPEIHPFDIVFGLQQVQVALAKKEGPRNGVESLGPLNSSVG